MQKLNKDFIKVISSEVKSFNFMFSLILFLALLEMDLSYLLLVRKNSSMPIFSSKLLILVISVFEQDTKKLSKSKIPFNKVGLILLAAEYKLFKTSLFMKAILIIRSPFILFKLFLSS